MTEAQYIRVSNLARLRVLQSGVGWLLPQNDKQHEYLVAIQRAVHAWEAELEKSLDGQVR